jgi:bifunctional enzyme CysN/CysC
MAPDPGAAFGQSPGPDQSGGVVWHPGLVDAQQRARATGGRGLTVWLTGLSGSGKSTIACEVERRLVVAGRAAYVLDGDNLRHGLNADLGFAAADRDENVRRTAEVARLMADAGLVVLAALVSPYRAGRDAARALHDQAGLGFVEVFVDTPIDKCRERDPKGLYARAATGELTGLTGVDAPYEPPVAPELLLHGDSGSVGDVCDELVALITDAS